MDILPRILSAISRYGGLKESSVAIVIHPCEMLVSEMFVSLLDMIANLAPAGKGDGPAGLCHFVRESVRHDCPICCMVRTCWHKMSIGANMAMEITASL